MKIKEILKSDLRINWDYVMTFPEFAILEKTEQTPIWHREGNVYIHTTMVCNEMYNFITRHNIETHRAEILMLSALFHDIGKGVTTKFVDGDWTSPNHAKASEQITRKLLWDEDFYVREEICMLVSNHMRPLYLKGSDADKRRMVLKIAEECNISNLLILKECDCRGSINDEPEDVWGLKLMEFDIIARELNCYNYQYDFLNNISKFKYFHSDLEYPPQIIFDDTNFKVIIMCGLPGCGKDTYIKENHSDYPTICRDDIRVEIGLKGEKPQGNKKEESLVTQMVNDRIKDYCRNKQNFVINATSIRKQHREALIGLMMPYNPSIEIVYVEAPTLKDNLNRRKGQISEDVIIKMRDTMDFPRSYEAHKLTIIKQ